MLRFAVLGFPISHSRSPEIYAPMFRGAGLEAEFLRIPVKAGEAGRIRGIAEELDGFALTMPLKLAAIPYLDGLAPSAAACGAVNIVEKRRGLLIGHNTDGTGLVDALLESGFDPAGKTAAILGRGGAARAAKYALEKHGCSVRYLVRSLRAGDEELIENVLNGEDGFSAELFINAAPLGMEAGERFTYFELPVRLGSELVFDMVYRPGGETELVRTTRSRGVPAIGGEELLYRQAVRAFEIWTGLKPVRLT